MENQNIEWKEQVIWVYCPTHFAMDSDETPQERNLPQSQSPYTSILENPYYFENEVLCSGYTNKLWLQK